MTHHHKAFITEDDVPGFLDGPKCVVPLTNLNVPFYEGQALEAANKLGYQVLRGPIRVGVVCNPRTKKLMNYTGGEEGTVRAAAFEVGKTE